MDSIQIIGLERKKEIQLKLNSNLVIYKLKDKIMDILADTIAERDGKIFNKSFVKYFQANINNIIADNVITWKDYNNNNRESYNIHVSMERTNVLMEPGYNLTIYGGVIGYNDAITITFNDGKLKEELPRYDYKPTIKNLQDNLDNLDKIIDGYNKIVRQASAFKSEYDIHWSVKKEYFNIIDGFFYNC